MNIGAAVSSDLTNAMTDFSVDTQSTEGPTEQKETAWTNTKWTQYLGYYKSIPELKSVIDARAIWTVGKGYEADPITKMFLDAIRGNGMDTFNSILANCIRTYHTGGDSYCLIVRNKKGNLINLRPLDPAVMSHIISDKGMLIRFEQRSKVKGKRPKRFAPEEIFYLPRNRIADEMHGISDIEKIEQIILMRNEAMADYKKVMHWFVKPRWIFHLDTDNPTKIAAFKAKYDKANAEGENMYIPKDAVVPELMAVSANATMSPLSWIEALNDYFYEAVGVPKVIVGNSKNFTEASSNTVYLAFQQSIEEEQLFIEEQVSMQLGKEIELIFPASMENSALSDKPKETKAEKAIGPTEGATTAGVSK